MRIWNTIVILFAAVLPHTFYTILPLKYNWIVHLFLLVFSYLILISLEWKFERRIVLITSITLFLAACALGMTYQLEKGSILIAPVITALAYTYFRQKEFSLGTVLIVWLALILYFIGIYYSKLPSFFNRGIAFDEDAIVFERASSNGIAIALNFICLFAIAVRDKTNTGNGKLLVTFAVLNFTLILIQGSRSGILTSALLVLYLWNLKAKYILIAGIFFVPVLFSEGTLNIDFRGTNEIRYLAQYQYIELLLESFSVVGPPVQTYAGIEYTFNVFLDSISRYTIFFPFIILGSMLIALRKSFRSNKLFLLCFLFVYFMTEGIFFPEYWDFLVWILIIDLINNNDSYIYRGISSNT